MPVFGRKKKKKDATPEFIKDRTRVFVCTQTGTGELNIENYGSLGDYSDTHIVLHAYRCDIVIEGEKLLIQYFTDIDMKITGRIHSIHY